MINGKLEGIVIPDYHGIIGRQLSQFKFQTLIKNLFVFRGIEALGIHVFNFQIDLLFVKN